MVRSNGDLWRLKLGGAFNYGIHDTGRFHEPLWVLVVARSSPGSASPREVAPFSPNDDMQVAQGVGTRSFALCTSATAGGSDCGLFLAILQLYEKLVDMIVCQT